MPCVREGIRLKFPNGRINEANIEVVVSGYSDISEIGAARLALIATTSLNDVRCPSSLATTLPQAKMYKAVEFDWNTADLLFEIPAPMSFGKLCLINTARTIQPAVLEIGPAALASLPKRISLREGRCSLASEGDCSLNIIPDISTAIRFFVGLTRLYKLFDCCSVAGLLVERFRGLERVYLQAAAMHSFLSSMFK